MSFFTTKDQVRLHYKDWGGGKPVVFVSSWAFSSEMWEYQAVPLALQGLRCITYDRRGHGRSDDPGRGYDFDTFADDLAGLLNQLALQDITLVGHSMGCAEIARYLARHGADRVARVVLLGTVTPFLRQTADNPTGAPPAYFDYQIERMMADRPLYFADGAIKFLGLGATWPKPPVLSTELVQWATQLALPSSPYAIVQSYRSLTETDFRADLAAFTRPTLVIHGDQDRNSPLIYAQQTAQAIAGSELRIYSGEAHGLFLTAKERLNQDLLAFVTG